MTNARIRCLKAAMLTTLGLNVGVHANANPTNRALFVRYYGRFLSKRLADCSTCHVRSEPGKLPASLAEFPHNSFGIRLALLGEKLRKEEKKADIVTRLRMIASEDSDGDGIDNLSELLLGHSPGDAKDKPSAKELARLPQLKADFSKYLASYRWEPFEPVHRPAVPHVKNAAWVRNPIDAFIAAEHESRGLKPRPPAPKGVLLRRAYLDLTGLLPTPEELQSFENDRSPNAYEKVVDRLLASPRYGERWGRHWMDVWRYSDWAGWADGNQIRDSKPHIWRWRDWIVESLNDDKGYDRMAIEMLAADELCPEDTNALRATGFLVRNFKLLSREQWMEDTLNHTSRAFLGLTMHCSKCHNHMYDPITQDEYYRMRAIFEPHNVRTDRVPGQPDTAKDGLVRVYDKDVKAVTYFYPRGDERHPNKDHPMTPGVPSSLGGPFKPEPVLLPRLAREPDKREFVTQETIAAAEKIVLDTKKAYEAVGDSTSEKRMFAELNYQIAVARRDSLMAILKVEKLEEAGDKSSEYWKHAATETCDLQRKQGLLEARFNLANAKKALADAETAVAEKKPKAPDTKPLKTKVDEAEKALAKAEEEIKTPATTAYKPRPIEIFPSESTGRRLAFAKWLVDAQNPLAARVAVNHIWARHFAEGIVPSLADLGRNGRPPSHPQLLDWLATELVSPSAVDGFENRKSKIENPTPWSMKRIHRLIVTSNTYRMASTPDIADARIDPDNVYLWRMPSKRMEAEAVRDNVLWASRQLDLTMGGPEIDHNLGLTSKRRSIYLRIAAEKEVDFLKIFDGPSVTECYRRNQSVMPQQALALGNSELALAQAKVLAKELSMKAGPDSTGFIIEAFIRLFTRRPTPNELSVCQQFLRDNSPKPVVLATTIVAGATQAPTAKSETDPFLRSRENLIRVLFNHNDFVTVR